MTLRATPRQIAEAAVQWANIALPLKTVAHKSGLSMGQVRHAIRKHPGLFPPRGRARVVYHDDTLRKIAKLRQEGYTWRQVAEAINASEKSVIISMDRHKDIINELGLCMRKPVVKKQATPRPDTTERDITIMRLVPVKGARGAARVLGLTPGVVSGVLSRSRHAP